jgi:hypothetical protein
LLSGAQDKSSLYEEEPLTNQGKLMTTVKFDAYKHQVRPVVVYPALFDDKTKLPKPAKEVDGMNVSLHEVLDTMTLALQAGTVNTHGWPQQFFANRKAFDGFLEQLECYDECFRITDEWWDALALLAYGDKGGDEEGFITTAEMAQAIASKAEEDGLLVNFGKKTPTYKYSPQECEEADYRLTATHARGNNYRMDMAEAERAEYDRLSDILSFGHSYFDTTLTPERHAAATAEGKALLKAKKPAKAKTKVATKAKK